jgi:hypothetical protein
MEAFILCLGDSDESEEKTGKIPVFLEVTGKFIF